MNHDPESCWMAVYSAYYDASGSETAPDEPIVVTGVVGKEAGWLALERAWLAVLRAHNVPYIHMKEIEYGKSPFVGTAKNHALFNRLVRVIKDHTRKTFHIRLVPSDVAAVAVEYDLSLAGGAYALAAQAAIANVDNWFRAHTKPAPLHHFVEKGDTGQQHFRRLQSAEEDPATILPSKSPITGERFVPFQVADFLGYEHRRAMKYQLRDGQIEMRESLAVILKNLPVDRFMVDQEMLVKLCNDNPDLLPRRNAKRPPSQD